MSEKITSHENIIESPLSQTEIEERVKPFTTQEMSIKAGAQLDTMLLDLEESPSKAGESFSLRKAEIEDALNIVNTTKPDDEKGLGPIGVIDERIGIMKNAVAVEKDLDRKKSWESRVASLELARNTLAMVFDEPTDRLSNMAQRLEQRGKLTEELYQDHQDVINLDIREEHNSRIQENDKRRKFLEQKKLVQNTSTRQ